MKEWGGKVSCVQVEDDEQGDKKFSWNTADIDFLKSYVYISIYLYRRLLISRL